MPIPTAAGTNYSWIKQVALEVTTAASPATTISNRKIALASGATSGLAIHWKAAAYAQPASGNMPAASGSNGAVPAGYTQATTTATVYDSAGVSGGSTGRNGSLLVLVAGVDNTYGAGAGSGVALPNLTLSYDEA